jgi:hypothetical protein
MIHLYFLLGVEAGFFLCFPGRGEVFALPWNGYRISPEDERNREKMIRKI